MSEENKPTGPTRFETLFGGAKVPVFLGDFESKEVIDEEVFVRQVPVSEFDAMFEASGSESEMVKVATGKDDKWLRRLAPVSFTKLSSEVRRVNADFLAYCDRRLRADWEAARIMGIKPQTKLPQPSPSRTTSPNSRRLPASTAESP